MSDASGSGYGRNYDGTRGDVLDRLEMVLRSTPPQALVTAPLRRALLEATVQEIVRLRGEVDSLELCSKGANHGRRAGIFGCRRGCCGGDVRC